VSDIACRLLRVDYCVSDTWLTHAVRAYAQVVELDVDFGIEPSNIIDGMGAVNAIRHE